MGILKAFHHFTLYVFITDSVSRLLWTTFSLDISNKWITFKWHDVFEIVSFSAKVGRYQQQLTDLFTFVDFFPPDSPEDRTQAFTETKQDHHQELQPKHKF